MKIIVPVLLVCLVCGPLFSQSAPAPQNDNSGASDGPDYEPYTEDEFPGWLRDLRRAEVIAVGSFPITMLFTSLTYEGIRAIRNAAGGAVTTGSAGFGSASFTPEESKAILITGGLLSVAVAVADYLIGRIGKTDGKADGKTDGK